MYAQWGGFIHPNHEVNMVQYEYVPILSKRNKRRETLHRITLEGEIQAVGQDAIKARIEALIAAYAVDYQDFLYLHDDATTRSPHSLLTNHPDNLTGNRVVARSWPKGEPGEYIVCRNFTIVIASRWYDAEQNIVEFSETVRNLGTGGTEVEVIPRRVGLPVTQTIYNQTPSVVIQYGHLFTMSPGANLFVPPPLWMTPIEQETERFIGPISPTNQGQQFADYGVQWSYKYISPTPIFGMPNAF